MDDKPHLAEVAGAEGLEDDRTTRRRLKKEVVEERVARVDALVSLPDAEFAAISLPADVMRELLLARKLKLSGAKQRQIRYTAKLLAGREGLLDDPHFHEPGSAELWCERLLADGDSAIEALLIACPMAERQRLRQILRASAPDQARLLQYLTELDPPAPDEEPVGHDD